MILTDSDIRYLCVAESPRVLGKSPLISPFAESSRFAGVSRGLSHCGYDLTLGSDFLSYLSARDISGGVEGPLSPENAERDPRLLRFSVPESLVLMPGQSVCATTQETISMPLDLQAEIKDKSTWARLFLDCKNTIIEPGWSGKITLELSNRNPNPILLTVGVGIAQIIFTQLNYPVEKGYPADGKYANQTTVTPARGS